MPILLFMNGMQVEVPHGTVLIFNPTSLSLDGMRDVQFHVEEEGGLVTFQTKEAVLEKMPNSLFYKQYIFHRNHHNHVYDHDDVVVHTSEPSDEEEEKNLEFFPLIFDFMLRKFDEEEDALPPYTDWLSFQQMQRFKRLCDYLLPGLLGRNTTRSVMDKKRAAYASRMDSFFDDIKMCIENNQASNFRNLVLNNYKPSRWAWAQNQPLEEGLLWLLSSVEVTQARLQMLSILFHPNEFGGRFFLDPQGNHTIFTELIKSIAVPQSEYVLEYRKRRTVQERYADLQAIVQHLVMELRMPIHCYVTRNRGFRVLPYDEPQSLVDLAASHADWIAFAVFANYFPGRNDYHLVSGHLLTFCSSIPLPADLPACVEHILMPYISDTELGIALHQINTRLTALHYKKASKSKTFIEHYTEIFTKTKIIIENAMASRGLI